MEALDTMMNFYHLLQRLRPPGSQRGERRRGASEGTFWSWNAGVLLRTHTQQDLWRMEKTSQTNMFLPTRQMMIVFIPSFAGLIHLAKYCPVRVHIICGVSPSDRLLPAPAPVLDVVRVQPDLVSQILELDHRATRHVLAGASCTRKKKRLGIERTDEKLL